MEQEKFDKIVDLVAKQMGLENHMSPKFIGEALQAIDRFDKKNSEKRGKFKFGALEVVMKMDEDYENLVGHYNPESDFSFDSEEQLLQSWEDLAVYSIMGKLVQQDEWE